MIRSACHDNQANEYDTLIKERSTDKNDYIREGYFELHNRIIEILDINRNDYLLDIGIGTGLLEEKINKNCKIAGIDISTKMIDKIKEKDLAVEVKEGSFLKIPYKDKCFNKILSCFAFHHLTTIEKERAVKEIERVLSDGGMIIIGDFMFLNEREKMDLVDKFISEKRYDMIQEMNEENFTNIEWFVNLFNADTNNIHYERMSTLSWIVTIQKK